MGPLDVYHRGTDSVFLRPSLLTATRLRFPAARRAGVYFPRPCFGLGASSVALCMHMSTLGRRPCGKISKLRTFANCFATT